MSKSKFDSLKNAIHIVVKIFIHNLSIMSLFFYKLCYKYIGRYSYENDKHTSYTYTGRCIVHIGLSKNRHKIPTIIIMWPS